MNDEIKEIVDDLIKNRDKLVRGFYFPEDLLGTLDLIKLIDYITNLQIENEDYKSRCEKANKFIKEKISSTQGVINDYMYHKEHNKILIELLQEDIEMYKKELNILNGGDEE